MTLQRVDGPETVAELRGVSRSFGADRALDDVSLTIPRAGVFGLIGPNGAGKTTIIRHMLGLLRAQTGSVRVFGLDPVADPVGVLGRIGYLSEDRDMPDWMPVAQLMRYTQAFYPTWDDAYAEELRGLFELDAHKRVRELSRGGRAKMGLLLALAHRPDFLVLDEPSSGLDPAVRRDILAAIIRTVADEGRTVLLSSHHLDEVERVSDRVAMIYEGRIIVDGTVEDVLASHRRLTVRFAQAPATTPVFTGAIRAKGIGGEWIVIAGENRAGLDADIARQGGVVVHEEEISLEEVFLARVQRKGDNHDGIAVAGTR